MIAVLQRTILALWLTASIGTVIAWTLDIAPGSLILLSFALLMTSHAAVLGGEFLVMHRINRSDPAPRAAWRQVLAAWIEEIVHAPKVFFWRQPLWNDKWPNRMPAEAMGRRGVILVHGYFCNRGLWNQWLERLASRQTPCIAVTLEPAFGSIDAYASIIDDAVQEMTTSTGMPPVIVAHSMGGLATRCWWADTTPERIHHLITLGTPHKGTRLASLGSTENARQMRVDSPWLLALAAKERPDAAGLITCVYSHCDNIVFPASRARLKGARAVHLPATPHVAMVDHPVAWALLEEQLNPASARPDASGPVPCSRTGP